MSSVQSSTLPRMKTSGIEFPNVMPNAIGLSSMEITCNRCHQAVQADNCYCPACGLPQLVYTAEARYRSTAGERWTEAVRDASD